MIESDLQSVSEFSLPAMLYVTDFAHTNIFSGGSQQKPSLVGMTIWLRSSKRSHCLGSEGSQVELWEPEQFPKVVKIGISKLELGSFGRQ